jgi:hypothetical protein
MNEPMHPEPLALPRRTVLKAAGLGVSAGLLADLATPASAATGEIWSAESYDSVRKGDRVQVTAVQGLTLQVRKNRED